MINRELITTLVATNNAIRYELSSLFLSLFNIHTHEGTYTYIYYTSSKRIQDDHHRPASSLSSSKFSRFVRSCRRFVSWIAVAKSLSFVSRLGDWLITNKLSSAGYAMGVESIVVFGESIFFEGEPDDRDRTCIDLLRCSSHLLLLLLSDFTTLFLSWSHFSSLFSWNEWSYRVSFDLSIAISQLLVDRLTDTAVITI